MAMERQPDPEGRPRQDHACRANSCRTNITARPATRRSTASRKNSEMRVANRDFHSPFATPLTSPPSPAAAATPSARSSWRESACSVTATPLAAKSASDLAQDVGVAGLLEIGRDHLLGVGGGGVAGLAELFGGPQPEQPVAAGLRLEFLLLVEGKLLLKAFLALVECGSCVGSNSWLIGCRGPRCGGPCACLDRGRESAKQRAAKPQARWYKLSAGWRRIDCAG